jgi:UDP-N-acetylmuramoylalanine--D-glutamate ligase
MFRKVSSILKGKRILILGFGKEGISTYKLLLRTISPEWIAIADQDENLPEKLEFQIHPHCKLYLGKSYLDHLGLYDVIIKSPGVSTKLLNGLVSTRKITSQTELFLKIFADRTIGVTGTKGKSTTSSLISHILSSYFNDVLLVGNIGIPAFDLIDRIGENTKIVYELSSHQLEHIAISPYIAVLLNLYEEHLDHYENFSEYQLAKFNITKYQSEDNWFIMNGDDHLLTGLYHNSYLNRKLFVFSNKKLNNNGVFIEGDGKVICYFKGKVSKFDFNDRLYLPGVHNLKNIMAAICVAKILGVPDAVIYPSICEFKGLKHRMEYIGTHGGVIFYNDSISTIPQATILAVQSLKKVDTLILGGKDRGINYKPLVDFLPGSKIKNLILVGEAGKRILDGLIKAGIPADQKTFFIYDYNEIIPIVRKHTKPGSICLLSPAAASYDQFRNFEERGEVFKKIAETL